AQLPAPRLAGRRRHRVARHRRPGEGPRPGSAGAGGRAAGVAGGGARTVSAAAAAGPLRVERRDDLLFATLEDPARANALSPALAAELTALYRRDLRAEGIRAVLLAGAGKHFCAGADLEHLAALQSASPEENR